MEGADLDGLLTHVNISARLLLPFSFLFVLYVVAVFQRVATKPLPRRKMTRELARSLLPLCCVTAGAFLGVTHALTPFDWWLGLPMYLLLLSFMFVCSYAFAFLVSGVVHGSQARLPG